MPGCFREFVVPVSRGTVVYGFGAYQPFFDFWSGGDTNFAVQINEELGTVDLVLASELDFETQSTHSFEVQKDVLDGELDGIPPLTWCVTIDVEDQEFVDVPLVADGVQEPNEVFGIILSSPANAELEVANSDGLHGVGEIIDANDPPVAVNDSYSIGEGTTLMVSAAEGVLANDWDPENDDLDAFHTEGPDHGSVTFPEGIRQRLKALSLTRPRHASVNAIETLTANQIVVFPCVHEAMRKYAGFRIPRTAKKGRSSFVAIDPAFW